jgi:hypothetical protein
LSQAVGVPPLSDGESCRSAGPGSPLALGLGDATFSTLWLWEGLSGQGACLTLSLLVDDVEVSWHVEMVGCVVHAHPRLPSFCWAHLFHPQHSRKCGKQS